MSNPAGIVMPFAGTVAPQGCLLCDGSAVSRTTYAELFAVIGTTYGAGDGETTFNIPDLSGRVVIGVSNSHALASTGGSETVTLTSDQLPAHLHVVPQHGHENDIQMKTPAFAHNVNFPGFKYNGFYYSTLANGSSTYRNSATNTYATRTQDLLVADHASANCNMSGSVTKCNSFSSGTYGNGGAHNNMQPYISVNYIILTGGV